ncbi:protein sidekick-2-like [Mercenaria mercenaria]|uniref:protein sidekick-2-like n=1 Tax=Mercenaria mercenaria TaxID=6596 RepID=UPI00234F2E4D|nr:protein sidekick-2-like [Mercenaria mercenaria]
MSSNHRLKSHWTFHAIHVLLVLILVQNQQNIGCHAQEYPPTSFRQSPTAGNPIPLGSAKLLLCRTNSNPTPLYRWSKDGIYISNASAIYTHRIDNVARFDAGRYRCEASNSFGAILSTPADVEVAYMSPFVGEGLQYTVTTNVSKAIVIEVPKIDSHPTPIFTWNKNNQPMNVEGSRYQVTMNGSLVLLDRKIDDSANYYKIDALNGYINPTDNPFKEGPVFYVTVTANSQGAARQGPVIVIGPQDKIVNKDQDTTVDFECIFNASPVEELQISWYKVTDVRNQILPSNKYLITTIGQRRLTIVTPNPSDNGLYECEASLSGFDRVSASANLTVYVSPTMTNQISNEIPRDFGQTVTINCTASGFPTPTVHWYFNGKEIGKDFNSSSYTLHPNGSLAVSQLDLEHDGVYQCFLRNAAGETAKATWLKVNSSPPRMIEAPSNITILEGGNARFTCETKGAPKPVVRWGKETAGGGSVEITDSGRFQILEGGSLLIVSVERDDSGIYTCNSSNSQGHIAASASLSVYVRTQIIRPPQDQRIIKGSTATFYCGVSHDQNIQVTWKWTHRMLHTDSDLVINSDVRRSIATDGTLTITGINNIDIGDYTCHVTSTGGNDTKTVSLTVIELPQAPVITSVTLHPTDVRAVIVKWNPGYDGNTPITKFSVQYKEVLYANEGNNDLGWLTSDAEIQPDVREATVTGLRPARHYKFRVFASNEVGEGLPSDPKPDPAIEMPQQPPSSPPKGFTGMPHTNTSVMLVWQPPDEDTWNGPLQGYTIQYKLAGYPNSTFQRTTVNQLSVSPRYQLTGLAYNEAYEIQIAAYNIEGVGVFSNLIRVKTEEGHPTAPPEGLEVIPLNSTAVNVRWTPPNQQFINGINLGYKVLGKRLEGVFSEFVNVVPHDTTNPTGTQQTILHSLQKYTEYNITVLCYTKMGDGPKALPKTVRTLEDVPSQVGSLTFSDIRSTSLKVNWDPPTEINGVLTGYTLLYEKKNDSSTRQRVDLPPSNLTFTVFSLTPMTKYTISVYASTGVGAGPSRSADIESGVPPELPAPPYNLAVSNIGARSVLLQFLPGFDGKTSITLWIVEALEDMHATQWKTIYTKYNPSARSLQVENLKPYTHYKLRITAENIVGQSGASEPTRLFQTLQDAPGAPPGNVTVRALNATALRVSWTPLSKGDWNGEPRGYKIYYRLKDAAGDFQIVDLDNGMNLDSAILGRLQEWMQYEVKMIAYNDVGASSNSSITVERTRESVPSEGPQNVHAVPISSTSVNVSWGDVPTLEQNGMILGFKVEYRSSERNIPTQSKDVSGNTTTHVLLENLRKFVTYEIRVLAYTRMGDGVPSSPEIVVQTNADGMLLTLRPNTEYVFRVAATNDIGTSPFSVQSESVRTLEDYPEGAPRHVKVERLTTTSVKVTWEQPLPNTWNGDLLGYVLMYRQAENTNYMEVEIPVISTEKVLPNLVKFVNYEFLVKAFNAIGKGPASTPVTVFVGEAAPTAAPVNVTPVALNSTEIQVTWLPPPPETQNGDLSGYRISYWRRTDPESTAKQVTKREQSVILVGLDIYTEYAISVQAINLAGEGPKSAVKYEKTLEGLPGKPASLKFWNVTYISLDVHWEAPVKPNGKIVNYELSYLEQNSASGSKLVKFNVSGNLHQLNIKDLQENVTYLFSVSARTAIGQGERTDQSVKVGPQPGSPEAPYQLRISMESNGQKLMLEWVSGKQGLMPIYGHLIQAKQADGYTRNGFRYSSQWTPVKQMGYETRAEINLLQFNPNTEYMLRVIALNPYGMSPYSVPSQAFRTPATASPDITKEKAFHYQAWFLVIVALTGVIVILVVISLLCLVSRRNKSKQRKGTVLSSTSNLTPSVMEPEDGGFSNFEMTQGRQSTHSRRHKFAGIRNGAANNIYARSPPRPSPASVAYSDDDSASAAKPPLPDDDDTVSSCTEKPSDIGDSSEASDEASDDDSLDLPPPPPPASPPPPPFSHAVRNPYPSGGATAAPPPIPSHSYTSRGAPDLPDRGVPNNSSWQNQNNSSFNAYQYTDSEAESSHYAFSLNGGQIMLNNTAGSRAPLPGFSSFV